MEKPEQQNGLCRDACEPPGIGSLSSIVGKASRHTHRSWRFCSALSGLEPMFVDSQALDLGLESGPRKSKLGRRTGCARDSAPALRQCGFDHLPFPVNERSRERKELFSLQGRSTLQPCLVDREGFTVAKDDRTLHHILQF